MTNEFVHKTVGDEQSQAEWEALGTHIFNNQSTGDILYASSATQLSRLAIASTGNILSIISGIPAWVGGSSGSPTSYTAGTPLIQIYATSSNATSTNAEPFYLKSVMTGAGGYGGRARFHAYTNVALGSNFMGLKSQAEFGSAGSCAGLATALCAELNMPNTDITSKGGHYYALELEYVSGGSSLVTNGTGCQAGFIYMNQSGDDDGDFDDNGFLFKLDGLTAGNTHLWSTGASAASGDATLKISIGGTTKYLLVADDAS